MIKRKLLVVNPNSSKYMTQEIQENIERSLKQNQSDTTDFEIVYFTAPCDAPRQIDGIRSSIESADVCMPIFLNHDSKFYYQNFKGILIGCFSDHPLVDQLINQSKIENVNIPIIGLLNTSIHYCSLLGNKRFSILTSNKEWTEILNNSVNTKFLDLQTREKCLWRGTVSTDLQVLDLHNSDNLTYIENSIRDKCINELDSEIIILGCAGFSSISSELRKSFVLQSNVVFVDTINLGIETLMLMARL